VVRVTEGGALFLEADPAWARAITAVLVERGVKVSDCARSPERRSSWRPKGEATEGEDKDPQRRTDKRRITRKE
jgi:hypothetical protein